MKVEFSPVAKDDLLEIALYIAQDNPVRALSFVDELEAQCLRLGKRRVLAHHARNWGKASVCSRMGAT